jgi:hypothetical protein
MAEAAAAITADLDGDGGEDQWGLYGEVPLHLLVWQAGGDVVAPDRRRSLLREPAALEALRFYAQLYHDYRAAPTLPVDGAHLGFGVDGIRVERIPTRAAPLPVAMTYQRAPSREFSPHRATKIAPVPRGRTRATQLDVDLAIAVTAKAPEPALAVRAIAACLLAFEESGFATGRTVRSTAKSDTAVVPNAEDAAVIEQSLAYARGLPLDLLATIATVLGTKVARPLREGVLSPQRAAEDGARELERLLAERPIS